MTSVFFHITLPQMATKSVAIQTWNAASAVPRNSFAAPSFLTFLQAGFQISEAPGNHLNMLPWASTWPPWPPCHMPTFQLIHPCVDESKPASLDPVTFFHHGLDFYVHQAKTYCSMCSVHEKEKEILFPGTCFYYCARLSKIVCWIPVHGKMTFLSSSCVSDSSPMTVFGKEIIRN